MRHTPDLRNTDYMSQNRQPGQNIGFGCWAIHSSSPSSFIRFILYLRHVAPTSWEAEKK